MRSRFRSQICDFYQLPRGALYVHFSDALDHGQLAAALHGGRCTVGASVAGAVPGDILNSVVNDLQ